MKLVLQERIRCGKKTIAVFIDFKSAFDSVHRDSLWKALLTIGVPEKMVKIVKAFYNESPCRVKVGRHLSASFIVRTGVRQGCALSPLVFNVTIDWIMKKSLEGRTGVQCGADGLKFTDADYADDVAFIEETE